jgi:hypothetical protein
MNERVRVSNDSSQQFAQFSPRALKSEFADVDQSSPRSFHPQTDEVKVIHDQLHVFFLPLKVPVKRSSKRSSKP